MRIAFLPSSYLPESVGGTEIYVHHLSEALTELGHKVAVVYHGAPKNGTSDFNYEVIGLDPYPATRRADLYLYGGPEDPPGVVQFLRGWQPDVLHFHALTLGAGLGHARIARRHGIPYVITYHTPTFSCRRGTLMRWGKEVCDGIIRPRRCSACVLQGQGWPGPLARLLALSPIPWAWLPEGPLVPRVALTALLSDGLDAWREFIGGAAHLIACADWCRDLLIANGIQADRIRVHRQAVPGKTRTRRLRLPLAERRPLRLGLFGRLTWVKGPDIFVRALQRLRARGLSVVGELVGPISECERAWVDRLLASADGSATYLGVKHATELTDWLDSLDLVVLPSRGLETGPLTLLEAWDRGVPVAGANLGSIPEFMASAGMQSLLFAPDDPEALAQAVMRAVLWPASPAPEIVVPGMTQLGAIMERLYQTLLGRPVVNLGRAPRAGPQASLH
jgi:glycosyltransferase involved in cell wall biosynthesis